MIVILLALSMAALSNDPAPCSKVRLGADRSEVQASIDGLRVPETVFLQGVLGQQLGLEGVSALSGVDVLARYYFDKNGGLAVIKLIPAKEHGRDSFRHAAQRAYGSNFSVETTVPTDPSDMGNVRRTWKTDGLTITHIDILGVPWLRERCNLTVHAPDFDRSPPPE